MALVKFVAKKNKNTLEKYYEYIEDILIEITNKGYLDSYEILTEDEYSSVFFDDVKKIRKSLKLFLNLRRTKELNNLLLTFRMKSIS